MFMPKFADGKPDVSNMILLYFKPDITEPEVVRQFEAKIGRPLTPDEQKDIDSMHGLALKSRADLISPNSKLNRSGLTEHEGCYSWFDGECERLKLDQLPNYLSADDLTDWIFTVQASDRSAYEHALTKWRETQTPTWLVAALIRAQKTSPRIERVIQEAQQIDPHSIAFPTIAYHLIRLKTDQGKSLEARKMLDQILAPQFAQLPVSTHNQFLEQRMRLADNVNDFLKFAQRRSVVFSDGEGALGTMTELLRIAKARWDPKYYGEDKAEYEQRTELEFQELLPWDDRVILDNGTIEILNWHFPLVDLEQAARNPVLPEYLRRRFVLAVWTRAIVLQNREVANRIAPEVPRLAPQMQTVFALYLNAQTEKEKDRAALFVLLQFPTLSP